MKKPKDIKGTKDKKEKKKLIIKCVTSKIIIKAP